MMIIIVNMVLLLLFMVGFLGLDVLVWGGGFVGLNWLVFVLKFSRNVGFSWVKGGGVDVVILVLVLVVCCFGD